MSGNYDYRQHLISNGAQIIQRDRAAAAAASFCAPCVQPYNTGTMAPETDRFVCDKVSCARVATTGGGQTPFAIGTGREYGQTPDAAISAAAFLAAQEAAQASWGR